MIEHVISHLISRKVEQRVDRWLDAGRKSLPIPDGDSFTLHFGTRYRVHTIVCAVIFVTFTLLAAWCHFFSEPLGFWLGLAYVALILPMTVVSICNALHALTHRVEVSHDGFSVRRVLLSDVNVPWKSVTSIRWRRLTSTILVDTDRSKRVRISTDLDGMYAFAELMSESPPGTRDKSVVDWVLEKL